MRTRSRHGLVGRWWCWLAGLFASVFILLQSLTLPARPKKKWRRARHRLKRFVRRRLAPCTRILKKIDENVNRAAKAVGGWLAKFALPVPALALAWAQPDRRALLRQLQTRARMKQRGARKARSWYRRCSRRLTRTLRAFSWIVNRKTQSLRRSLGGLASWSRLRTTAWINPVRRVVQGLLLPIFSLIARWQKAVNDVLANPLVVRYRPVAAAAVTLLLLLPVPLYAAINFGSVTWTANQPGNNALFSSITFSDVTNADPTQTHTILTFNLGAGQTSMGGTTTVTSSTIPALSTDTINGTWNNLSNLNVTSGNVTVSISVSNGGKPNNMFSDTYNTGHEPAASPTISPSTGLASPVITVTFSKSGATTVGTSSPISPAASFTLDFHN
jgi:hypothetical protein